MRKQFFAERNGFEKPSDVILTGGINAAVTDMISTCFSRLGDALEDDDEKMNRASGWTSYKDYSYYKLCLTVWTEFFGKRQNAYSVCHEGEDDAIQYHLLSKIVPWYKKLGMIEFSIDYMDRTFQDPERREIKDQFVVDLNEGFERTHYGYRVVDGIVVDIISPAEIKALEEVLVGEDDIVKYHMRQALALYSQRPEPDYRNSIKEAITAVEALFREKTGESKFGLAYAKVKSRISIHPRLQEAIQKMYDYTNQPDTGIRHSNVVGDGSLVPGASECQFMLVTCSAVINYIQEKSSER